MLNPAANVHVISIDDFTYNSKIKVLGQDIAFNIY